MEKSLTIRERIKKGGGSEITICIAYIGLCIIFSILSPNFFSGKNFINIGIYSAIMGITAAATTLVLICGCIDISVGAVMGLTGMISALLLKAGVPIVVAVLIALLAGAAVGTINGLLVSKGKIVPMIATMATMSIIRGIAYLTNNGISIVVSNAKFNWLGRGYVGPVPFILIIMAIVYLGMFYLSKYTAYGRKLYATGSNQRAGYLAGINTDRTILSVYVLNGVFAGLSGILMAAQSGAGLPTAGDTYEMTIISACVLGGTSINGGKGNVWGTLVGVLLLTTISNGLTMLSISSFWQQIIKGTILLAAVLIDAWRGGSYKKV
ncbi:MULTISPECIES: ABC transporter permease [Diplocloster]|uniref:ABC transporter permease n=1 Tax=Diplocloster modestus TaxID=2850322 RepID=A0ABS6K805_9FIRM|nr:ABC transporter permease [Diplocloster modestus]MBU9726648.1 ABC transporter permease [Diplocloster modestus]